MTTIQKPTFRQVAEQYIDSRKTVATPISTAHALLALKSAMPNCALSDPELVNLVVELAVQRGRSVHFDVLAGRASDI
ncbi:MAG: hypothetical protein ABIQ51_25385 [Mesorhizobium sp.]